MGFFQERIRGLVGTKHTLLLLALAATLVIQLALLSTTVYGDENAHLSASRHIGQGEVIYRDFFDHHVPLPYFILGAAFSAVGPQIIAAKLVVAAANLLSAAFIFLIVKRFGGDGHALAATLFFAANIVPKGAAHFYVDVMVSAFALGALYFLLEALIFGKGAAHLFLAGLFLGLGLMCKQQVALAALFVLAFMLVLWLQGKRSGEAEGEGCQEEECRKEKGRIRLKHFPILAAGIAVPGGLILAYFAATGALNDAIYHILFYNLTEMPELFSGPPAPTTLKHFYEYLQIAPVIVAPVLLLPAFGKMDGKTRMASVMTLGFMATLATIMYPLWRNYHMISALNVSFILLALCVPPLFRGVVRMDWKRLRPESITNRKAFALLSVFILLFTGAYAASLVKDTMYEVNDKPRDGLVETAAYIREHTAPGEKVLTMPNLPLGTEINFRAQRDLPGKLAYFSTWSLTPKFQRELLNSTIEDNVRYVVWWSGQDVDLQQAAPIIYGFVFDGGNFTRVASFGEFDIYEKV